MWLVWATGEVHVGLVRKPEGKSSLFFFFLRFVDLRPNIVVFLYQLGTQILYFNTFITFLYMFRTLLCSSSGGQLY